MSRPEYLVYTLRRTSSRTVYAITDAVVGGPVSVDGVPVSTTTKRSAEELARALDRVGRIPAFDAQAEVAAGLIGCGVAQGKAHRWARERVTA